MRKLSTIFFAVFIVTLFSPIFCRSSNHEHNHDKNWIEFLPGVFQINGTSTTDDSNGIEIIKNFVEESSDPSSPTVLKSDYYNDNSSSKSVVIGVPIGGIILFILICYCCYRCFCSPKVVVQGATIIRPPAPQPQAPAPIVIHNVTNAPPPQQYPPPYPPNYEMGHPPQPMKQWNQVNQHAPPQQYYPDGGGYNPNAPPQYGRY